MWLQPGSQLAGFRVERDVAAPWSSQLYEVVCSPGAPASEGARTADRRLLLFVPQHERAATLVRLRHAASAAQDAPSPAWLPLTDLGETEEPSRGWLFSQPLPAGQPLDWLDAPVPLPLALRLALQLCEAAGRAQARGISLRCLHPRHVSVLASHDRIELAVPPLEHDRFANAESFDALSSKRSDPLLDARSEVWSLGLILHRLFTGREAFPGDSPQTRILRVMTQSLAPPMPTGAPPQLTAILLRSLERDRSARWPDAAALGRALLPLYGQDDELARAVASQPSATPERLDAEALVALTERQRSDPAASERQRRQAALDHLEARRLLALRHLERGAHDEALAALAPGGQVPATERVSYATVLHARGDHEQALLHLSDPPFGERQRALRLEASALHALGRYREALERWNEVIDQRPHDASLLRSRGASLYALGDLAGALRDDDAALSLAPDDPGVLVDRATTLLALGREADAAIDAGKALRLAPGDARACLLRARLAGGSQGLVDNFRAGEVRFALAWPDFPEHSATRLRVRLSPRRRWPRWSRPRWWVNSRFTRSRRRGRWRARAHRQASP